MIKGFISAFSILALMGCVGPKSSYVPQAVSISRPPIGQTTTVSVGDEMVSQGNLSVIKGIELPDENKIGGYTLSPGFYPMIADDGAFTFHAYRTGQPLGDGYGVLNVGFMMDPPKQVQASTTEQKICVVTAFGLKTCDTEHPYQRVERPSAAPNQFQQTLLYSGRSGSKINIGYREFTGSTARPAFSNDVEYDLSTSDTIAYKGARLKIISATNESITYQVISNFR